MSKARRWSRRVIAGLVLATASATAAAADQIEWIVRNNFGLFANDDTQTRFMKESKAYLDCMAKRFSPGQCDNGRTTFGLTQKPYAVRFDSKRLKYDPELLHPQAGAERDTVMVELSLKGGRDDQRCDWTLGGRRVKGAPCQGFRSAVKLDTDVEVSVEPRGRGANAATTVHVRRVVLATFGDSFMSGEGNPHRRSRVEPVRAELWLEPRCHRSLLTASAQAAVRHAAANPKQYIAYYNFACSGSTGEIGLLGTYEGVSSSRELDNMRGPDDVAAHFRGAKLPSQIEQAKAAFCPRRAGGCVSPDVVFVSIGINTLGFGDTIRDLGRRACDAKCLTSLEARISKGLKALEGDGADSLARVYRTLAKELSPKTAVVIEYPDPTRDDKGRYCDANALFPTLGRTPVGRIDAKENAWAHEKMLTPLNELIEKVVARHEGWTLLRGTTAATRRHGYCADKTFFNSGQAAKGTSGTMHPNVVGHDAVAKLMLPVIDAASKAKSP